MLPTSFPVKVMIKNKEQEYFSKTWMLILDITEKETGKEIDEQRFDLNAEPGEFKNLVHLSARTYLCNFRICK
jgi:hypothetical protein